jgi:hypothetical protein
VAGGAVAGGEADPREDGMPAGTGPSDTPPLPRAKQQPEPSVDFGTAGFGMAGFGVQHKPGEGTHGGKGNGESHLENSAAIATQKSPSSGGSFQEAAERLDPLGGDTVSERFGGVRKGMEMIDETIMSGQVAEYMGDAPTCSRCGFFTIRSGTCYRCLFCGESQGCS